MADAEAQAMAQLASLHRTARTALDTGRSARALELYDRALASAEATLPPDSLVIAALGYMSVVARITARVHATIGSATGGVHLQELARMSAPQLEATVAPMHAAWREEERALAASQRCLALLLGRWRAGTLLAPAPHEVAFYEVNAAVVQSRALELFVNCAADAVMWWPPLSEPPAEEARLGGVHGALMAVLQRLPQFRLGPQPQQPPSAEGQLILDPTSAQSLNDLLFRVASERPEVDKTLRGRLREVCGLLQADVESLQMIGIYLVARESLREASGRGSELSGMYEDTRDRAAADLARYGLRRCALPSCDAQEPHPKFFKLCGRCRGVVYCCPEHSKEDWKRHKREDGCKAAS